LQHIHLLGHALKGAPQSLAYRREKIVTLTKTKRKEFTVVTHDMRGSRISCLKKCSISYV
jgi:hypothetical protein